MKHQLFLIAATGIIGSAQAQLFTQQPMPSEKASYAGAVMGLTQFRGGCSFAPTLSAESLTNFTNTSTDSTNLPSSDITTRVTTHTASTSCDDEGKSFKVYAGTHVANRWFIEASLINFGKQNLDTNVIATAVATRRTTATPPVVVSETTTVTAAGTSDLSLSAQAVGLSMAYRHALNDRLLLISRVGLALVQTNFKKNYYNNNGVAFSTVEESETKLRPLIGFGAEFRVYDNVSAVLSSDFSTIKAGGETIRLNTFGLGVGVSFDN
jgi:opacity protein-like surface antigen